MKKNLLFMKGFTVGIILLFVATGIIPSVAQKIEKPPQPVLGGHWLYVGGSGPGNYTRIQDAVNNATDGDTVYVYHGTYTDFILTNYACVYIDKAINLTGENKYNTTIDGSFQLSVIRIWAAHQVQISGFTVRNSGSGLYFPSLAGIEVYYSDNITVDNNIFIENYIGVDFYDSSNITFFNNVIFDNNVGCHTPDKPNCFVHDNFFLNNTYGIQMWYGSPIIEYNELKGNKQAIDAYLSQGKVRFNNFIDNQLDVERVDISITPIGFIQFLLHKPIWDGNYWQDWNLPLPKPMLGIARVYIIFRLPPFNPTMLPLGIYPFILYDWHPAKEPYNIPG
ncbi:MAG TPA: hypothetical protein DSN98_08665 [Thermoplasmata archaeon]|jgi:parallel beta-helix repeat protein|nr:MAG TPA: hypothetical protein DSN98_08665 [Thermoplasmata archaeon]